MSVASFNSSISTLFAIQIIISKNYTLYHILHVILLNTERKEEERLNEVVFFINENKIIEWPRKELFV
jgi:hypothetical protein